MIFESNKAFQKRPCPYMLLGRKAYHRFKSVVRRAGPHFAHLPAPGGLQEAGAGMVEWQNWRGGETLIQIW